ncbi:hypothetical protein [Neorhizobium alkalisoli]|uniref:Uncharacterized protein n=1 Tax=Neorhizobium alkalisoli TaxID=528178 RepID=A0A561QHF6_9HYPH|nr:hypothetical protein [Neorhizobium alkalisoli]TWF49771.1 hypothetical protein FHW37_107138 [Neorhizobium alkalisoli]
MEDNDAVKLLDIYIENAVRIFGGGFGCDRAENEMFATVDLLREKESLRPEFLRRVSATLTRADVWETGSGDVPLELVELAIHELRWPEFRQLIELRRSLFPLDTKHLSLVGAFDPDWIDREYYQRYRTRDQEA